MPDPFETGPFKIQSSKSPDFKFQIRIVQATCAYLIIFCQNSIKCFLRVCLIIFNIFASVQPFTDCRDCAIFWSIENLMNAMMIENLLSLNMMSSFE